MLAQFAVDSDSRPFALGFLVHRATQGAYALRFWPDDDMAPETLAAVHAAVARSFFAVPRFEPASLEQAEGRMAAAPVPRLPFADSAPRYAALSPGVAFGRLRRLGAYERGEPVAPEDVLILGAAPRELPPAAGVLLAGPSSQLSHLSILARSLGMPLAAAPGADGRHRGLEGRLVRFEARADGYRLEPASRGQARAFRARAAKSRRAFRLLSDLDERSLAAGFHHPFLLLRRVRPGERAGGGAEGGRARPSPGGGRGLSARAPGRAPGQDPRRDA